MIMTYVHVCVNGRAPCHVEFPHMCTVDVCLNRGTMIGGLKKLIKAHRRSLLELISS